MGNEMKTLITAVKQCAALYKKACRKSGTLGDISNFEDATTELPWPALVEALEVLRDIHEFGSPEITSLTFTMGNGPTTIEPFVKIWASDPRCVRAFERLNELFREGK
jgi:hypothetical protein